MEPSVNRIEPAATAQPKPLIVVIEDDPAVRNSLKFSLEIEGYAVRLYADGGDLLEHRRLPCADCLVVDYNLPHLTGLEVIGQLRDRRIHAPAILITSNPNRNLLDRAAVAGARVVEKPLLGDALIEGIRDIVGSRAPQSTT